jgi:hypothetical protein
MKASAIVNTNQWQADLARLSRWARSSGGVGCVEQEILEYWLSIILISVIAPEMLGSFDDWPSLWRRADPTANELNTFGS